MFSLSFFIVKFFGEFKVRLNLYITQEPLYIKNIQQDLICRAKNTTIFNCYFYDEDDVIIDITGSEIYFMVKDTPSTLDASASINKKITLFTEPLNGFTEIELTSTDTSSLLGNYIYAIKIKYESDWYTLLEGNICFQQNIITREI